MDVFVLVTYASLADSRIVLQMITSLPELYFRFRRCILLVQAKNDFYELWQQHKLLKTMEMSEVWPDATIRDIYIHSNLNPPTKFTSSSRSIKSQVIIPWNISQMITKTIPISTRIVISYTIKWGILFWVYWKMVTETTTWSELPNGRKVIVDQILASEINKSKRAWLTESDSQGSKQES